MQLKRFAETKAADYWYDFPLSARFAETKDTQ
jgi:hypothetical protein